MRWPVVLAVVLAGCGADVPTLPDGLVLQGKQLVGMPSPRPAELPEFSLYGDGTVVRPGPPAGALQTAETVQIGQKRARDFYEAAHDEPFLHGSLGAGPGPLLSENGPARKPGEHVTVRYDLENGQVVDAALADNDEMHWVAGGMLGVVALGALLANLITWRPGPRQE